MKKVIISLIILFLITSGFFTYKFVFIRNKDDQKPVVDTTKHDSNKESNEMEEKENEPITENNEDNNDVIINDNSNNNRTSTSNMESNSVRNSNVVKENKTTNNVQNEEPKQESTPVQQPEPEQPKHEPTAWESLGISEYDYYHKPMWNWARVDYKVEDYGSFDATHQACIDAGNQLEDIISFSCTNINSYSGAYLGDMLRVKK